MVKIWEIKMETWMDKIMVMIMGTKMVKIVEMKMDA